MSATERLIAELHRTLTKAHAYKANPGEWHHSATHAALRRATLDLTNELSAWLQATMFTNSQAK